MATATGATSMLNTQLPQLDRGLAARLGRIASYCRKAADVAEALRVIPQITIVPDPPATNLMHLFIRADKARLEAAALELAREGL